MLLLMFANASSLLVCSVLKLPQIITVISAKTARGLSVRSLLLELIGFLIFLTYQTYYEYPLTTYLEYPVLIVQDVILLMCILFYNGNIGTALPYTILFIIGWRLLTIHKLIIDLAMSLSTCISALSKYAQLQSLWKTHDSDQVSALTWSLAIYTVCTRIFTTLVTTADTAVLIRYAVIGVLNVWVLITVMYYRKTGKQK
ncbi:solute carrier family 66 member 3 isoform X1 [Chiloscyllium plagiosum]|uniref:solute carrier family 66 member 3 isoform X1 n=1 Tax=Chiloscyllium plagiosum TaxID=36176 RepID=UPI001CB7F435|nr:solute carrier family 66 member 3 isoform X1 [Chiloscyllium plagiosum]XP_043533688.1 solute carrier family 66 member 3 isoform X1 [Chiloscyllium plagiosum]